MDTSLDQGQFLEVTTRNQDQSFRTYGLFLRICETYGVPSFSLAFDVSPLGDSLRWGKPVFFGASSLESIFTLDPQTTITKNLEEFSVDRGVPLRIVFHEDLNLKNHYGVFVTRSSANTRIPPYLILSSTVV